MAPRLRRRFDATWSIRRRGIGSSCLVDGIESPGQAGSDFLQSDQCRVWLLLGTCQRLSAFGTAGSSSIGDSDHSWRLTTGRCARWIIKLAGDILRYRAFGQMGGNSGRGMTAMVTPEFIRQPLVHVQGRLSLLNILQDKSRIR